MFSLGELKKRESVLILGASGGLGTMGIQIAKAAGATVIAGAGAPAWWCHSKLTIESTRSLP